MSALNASTHGMKSGAVTTSDVSAYVHEMIKDFTQGVQGWSSYAGTDEIGAAFREKYDQSGRALADAVTAYGTAVESSAQTVLDGAARLQHTQNNANGAMPHHSGKK